VPGLLLYSTNSLLKYRIQERFGPRLHYVWCSECFDGASVARHATGSGLPPSSNPAEIYRDLKDAAKRNDTHCTKINEQRATLAALAAKWLSAGQIIQDESDEICYLAANLPPSEFRPVLYLIPQSAVIGRRQVVHPTKRANPAEPEWIVPDLRGGEFEFIEP
jgi:hypothetical protein